MRRIAVLDAPSNLGLRPPTVTSVPGCGKAPGALRDHDLIGRLGARDAGCLTPPRYDPGDWRPGDGVCHAPSIASYSRALAERIGEIIDLGEFPVVLGGDCSVLLGAALAMHRLGEAVGGRIGLVYVDGHSDFRHPGNASYVGAAAGEGLALVTGRGQADLAAIEGRRPYFRDIDVVVLGVRAHDEYRLDLQAAGVLTRPVPALRAEGAARTAQWAHDQLTDCAGYWVHIDVDVLDPAVMPAVDAPDPGGIAFTELELLLAGLVDTPHCLGVEVTVFDPDYDPDGEYAAEIVGTLVAGLAPVVAPGAVPPRLVPARPAATLRRPGPVPGPRAVPNPGARAAPALGVRPFSRPSAAAAAPAAAEPRELVEHSELVEPGEREDAVAGPVAELADPPEDPVDPPAEPAVIDPPGEQPVADPPFRTDSTEDRPVTDPPVERPGGDQPGDGDPTASGRSARSEPSGALARWSEPVGPPAVAGPGRLRRGPSPVEGRPVVVPPVEGRPVVVPPVEGRPVAG